MTLGKKRDFLLLRFGAWMVLSSSHLNFSYTKEMGPSAFNRRPGFWFCKQDSHLTLIEGEKYKDITY